MLFYGQFIKKITSTGDAFEDIILSSEYGDYGQARMAFMTPRVHRALSNM